MKVYGIFRIIGYVDEWQIGEARYEVMCGKQRLMDTTDCKSNL